MAAAQQPQMTVAEEYLAAISTGKLAISDAAAWAQARVQEGGADDNMEAIARMTSGRAETWLHEWASRQAWHGAMPKPYSFLAPMLRNGKEVVDEIWCLLPHEVFGAIYSATPNTFRELFGTPAELEQFWAEMARTAAEAGEGRRANEHRAWLQRHPTGWAAASHRVPMGMHGDAGQMQGGEKVTVLSWGGLSRKGTTMDTRILFTVIKNSEMAGGFATLHRCFEVLAWSFGQLAKGTRPASDELGMVYGPDHDPERARLAGTPLALAPDGNLLGAWCELRGDWEFLRDALNLTHHYGPGDRICHLCSASRSEGPMWYGNFSRGALHRGTLVGPFPAGQRAWASNAPTSPLCRLPGFSVWRCMFDCMHTLDLGVLQRCVPAALQGLAGLPHGKSTKRAEPPVWPGGQKETRLQLATADYLDWAIKTRVPSSSRVKNHQKMGHRAVAGDQHGARESCGLTRNAAVGGT